MPILRSHLPKNCYSNHSGKILPHHSTSTVNGKDVPELLSLEGKAEHQSRQETLNQLASVPPPQGGMVHSSTDEFGFAAVEKRMHVHDLHATMLHLMGIDHEKLTYRYSGRDFRLTDVHGQVAREILS
jgi:hypothetical protein